MCESSPENEQSLDIYRETCLRYLGYFAVLGKLFPQGLSSIIPQTIATSYIIADVADKSTKTALETESKCKRFLNAIDASLWQATTSVLIPSLLVKSFSEMFTKVPAIPQFIPSRPLILPYILAFALMPIFSYPIDKSINIFMGQTYRKVFTGKSKICSYIFGETEDTIRSAKHTPLVTGIKNIDEIYEEGKSKKPLNQSNGQSKPTNTSSAKENNEKTDEDATNSNKKNSKKWRCPCF